MTEMTCTSCSKQRKNLMARRSAVVKGSPLILCKDCADRGFEPRHLIILAARTNGIDRVAEFLVKRRYYQGDKGPILAEELL